VLFNTFAFAGLFLPLTLLAFWFAPGDRAKRGILLASSLFFYGYWYWPYLGLLVGLVAIAWACALRVEKTRSTAPVWVAALLLLGILGFFKYAGFLATVAHDLGLADGESRRVHALALPIGLSFIAFQALGYVVDVYRGEFPAERRFSVVLLFKAFFPQLIAGPICRAHELMPQLKRQFRFDATQFFCGLAIFALGFLLKEVFADSLAPLVDKLYAPRANLGMVDAWAAAIGFGGQIYADFWGYSTMAVGLARMFGVDIPVNFRLPYLATSLRDFWRRWHITLSQWLRDYLYKPLGGSRRGRARTVFALMATMLLGGLWHGANYTFIVWGALHGFVQVLEHLLLPQQLSGQAWIRRARAAAGWLYVFVVVMVAWVFFRAENLGQAVAIVKAMFNGPVSWTLGIEVRQIFALSLALLLLQVPIEKLLAALRDLRVAPARAVIATFWGVVVGVVLGAPAAVPFIYFQF
jgi:D-alanyl-lipoteichoic acid acyltransferase DltB (MBOAT superfamily)